MTVSTRRGPFPARPSPLPRAAAWLAGLALAGVAASAFAAGSSWWNGDWRYRKEITLDLSATGANVAGTPQELPVLLRLSVANFAYFGDAKPDGSDFRVLAGDDKTPLKFHFERYDPQNQLAYVWVRVPQVAGGTKTEHLYVYYGNPGAATATDAEGTYDPGQALVLHFSDPKSPPQDSTAYHNNPASSSAELLPASLIGGGAKFSGAQSVAVPASPSLRLLPNQGLTISAWVKPDGAQAQAVVASLADAGKELTLGIDGGHAFARFAGGAAPVTVSATAPELGDGAWHFLALTAGGGHLTLYVDGESRGEAPASLVEIGGQLTIGATAAGGGFLRGELDELGVAKLPRSADWLRAVARSQGLESPLIAYGADAQKESGQGSYFVTIARNLTVDGWVVIFICFAMLIVGLVIMVMKALFLTRVERANRQFLGQFKQQWEAGSAYTNESAQARQATTTRQLGQLAESAAPLASSTQYRLFRVGIDELRKRLGATSGGQAIVLTPQSMEAIRATIDGTATRLQQELSARMVLLTIAISGGPFLGLLGTVIGVMITFAAIALSGDVNVNAIAPGTAAALAATVAGLAVAIPCLFGYNWLNTRIKSINADSRVFVDEFITRIAEEYS